MLLIVKVEITQSDMQMKPPVDTFTCWPATIPLLPSNSDLINLGGSEVKASARNAGDLGLISESGRSPGEGNGNPLQYSCLENPMEGRASWGCKELDMTKRFHFTSLYLTLKKTFHCRKER